MMRFLNPLRWNGRARWFAISGAVMLLSMYRLRQNAIRAHTAYNHTILIPMAVIGVVALIGWLVSILRPNWGAGVLRGLRKLGWFNAVLFAGLLAAFPLIYWTNAADFVLPYFPRMWMFPHLVLIGAVLLKGLRPNTRIEVLLAASALLMGVGYQIISFIPDVRNYPLSLGWSETSRYYNASLYLSPWIYGSAAPLPALHPTRYLMQAVPFLLPGLPIWVHRLWQVLLWLGLTWGGGAALAYRLKLPSRAWKLGVTAFAFLFFFQGPVYYHLMVCAIAVLLGFDRRHWGRTMTIVLLASVWAGISRVNWYPMPGLLAAALYFLEQPVEVKPSWRYLLAPVSWVLAGTALAVAVNRGYIAISGNPVGEFTSSFTSDLLWYRLKPNTTYPDGILISLGIVAAAPLYLLLRKVVFHLRAWHPWRWLGLGAILAVLLAGGIVVSVKIGGGSNLHNLDAFLVMLLVVAAYAVLDRAVPDHPERVRAYQPSWIAWGVLLFVPLLTVLAAGSWKTLPPAEKYQPELDRLVSTVEKAGANGEVLFITERQLLTFHQVQGVKLVPENERVYLMEMAMGNNLPYLERFVGDLQHHRFAVIVTGVVSTKIQDETYGFNEENNVWVDRVAKPLMEYYKVGVHLPVIGIDLLVPK
jgi:hypothetical protein